MISLKTLSGIYKIEKTNGQYHFYDKNPQSCTRFEHKYLFTAEKKNNSFRVKGFQQWTRTLSIFCHQIRGKMDSYKFDSSYYNPLLRTGSFEELVITDYMTSLGFKAYGNFFIKEDKNCYGQVNTIKITFEGLDSFDSQNNINFIYVISSTASVSNKMERDVEVIINFIDSFLESLHSH